MSPSMIAGLFDVTPSARAKLPLHVCLVEMPCRPAQLDDEAMINIAVNTADVN